MPEKKLYLDRNLQIIFSVTLMVIMGVGSITPAFPKIVEALGIAKTEVGLLIVAFTLPGVVLTPFVGIMADRVGRKRILVPSLFLFALAGGACGFTQDFNTLIILRVLQGTGAAALAAINNTLVGDIFTGERRTAAMGMNASVLSIGSMTYPLVGGALATFSWSYPFLLPFLAIPVGLLVAFKLNNPEPKRQGTLRDYLTGALGYLKNIRALAAFATGAIYYTILYGARVNYFSLYLGFNFGASPLLIGVISSTMSVVSASISPHLGRLSRIAAVPTLIKLGFALGAVALVLISIMPGVWWMLFPMVVYGAALAITQPALLTYVSGLAPTEYRAAFMAINGTMLRVGQTLGPLVMGAVFIWGDYSGVFLVAAALSAAVSLVGFIGGRMLR